MRWLIMLFLGMALGVGALFSYLRWYGDDAQSAQVAAAPAVPTPAPLDVLPPAVQPSPTDGGATTALADTGAAPAPAPDGAQAAAVEPNADPHLPTGQTGSARPEGKLLIPVEGVKAAHLNDTFTQPRGKEKQHEALDIMAPKGAKVLAVADGKVAKLYNSKPGGLTVYQFDPAEKFSYYYAHLDRYADNLKEGQAIKRGDLIGYVGVTGNSDPNAPHLHFGVFELPSTKEWWKGKPVNPFPLMQP